VTLELANLVLAAYMAGVGFIVQGVHYPLFAAVGAAQWPGYHEAHSRRITWVVAGPMLAAPAVAAALLAERPGPLSAANLMVAAGLLLVTATAFGRLHRRLRPWSEDGHRRLLRLNAARTAAWTLHTALAVALAATA
jgi:hypothetical protein